MKSGPSCVGGDTGHLRSVSSCRGSEGLFSSALASMQKHCEAKKMRLSISGPGCSSAGSEEVRVNPPSSADVVTLFFSFTSLAVGSASRGHPIANQLPIGARVFSLCTYSGWVLW